MTKIEDQLRNLDTEKNSAARVYISQWNQDRELLSQALTSVALTFPHYSLHDGSHSHTILVQLGRVLGQNRIRQLSPSTLWLLLSSAYYHDVGMLVRDDEKRKWWSENKDFRDFLEGILLDQHSDLYEPAKLLSDRSSHIKRDPYWPFTVTKSLTIVMAEFARRRHPERSSLIIREPKDYGIRSARTGRIPERLWRILEVICSSHGKSFEAIMELPVQENGLSEDDYAHPRFVAAMLRLGDLLDLDNGRFCPSMGKVFGEKPRISTAHERKHLSIRSFRVDSKVISVTADPVTIDAYHAVSNWLEMLATEVTNQSSNWTQIYPGSDFGSLPSIETLDVKLPDMILSRELADPSFEIREDHMLSLLRDSGLYTNPKDEFMREILQNAYDATIRRVWDNKSTARTSLASGPERVAMFRKETANHPVSIEFTRCSVSVESGKETWTVTVTDKGVGIARSDIGRIKHVATYKSPAMDMPEWLRPSGYFGVGLQSVFYVVNKFTILTRSIDTHESLEISLSKQQGVVARLTDERPYGTTIKIALEIEAKPSHVHCTNAGAYTHEALREYDAICGKTLPVDIWRMVDSAIMYACHPLIPVEITVDGKGVGTPNSFDQPIKIRTANVAIRNFKWNQNIESRRHVPGRSQFYYRGLPVGEVLNFPTPWASWISCDYDLYLSSAMSMLKWDRSAFRDRALDDHRIPQRIMVALAEQLDEIQDDSPHLNTAHYVVKMISSQAKHIVSNDSGDELQSRVANEWYEKIRAIEQRYSVRDPDGWRKVRVSEGYTLGDLDNGVHIWYARSSWRISKGRPRSATGGKLMASWTWESLGLFFSNIQCRGELQDGVSRSPLMYLTNRDIPAGVTESSFRTAVKVALGQLPSVGFRTALHIPERYKVLDVSGAQVYVGDAFILVPNGSTTICPFRADFDQYGSFLNAEPIPISAPNIVELFEWLVAETKHDRAEVASALLAMIGEMDQILREEKELIRRFIGFFGSWDFMSRAIEINYDLNEIQGAIQGCI